jgi:hypothetical protein
MKPPTIHIDHSNHGEEVEYRSNCRQLTPDECWLAVAANCWDAALKSPDNHIARVDAMRMMGCMEKIIGREMLMKLASRARRETNTRDRCIARMAHQVCTSRGLPVPTLPLIRGPLDIVGAEVPIAAPLALPT